MDNYRDIINRALDRESVAYKRGGWAWLVFGLVTQSVLALLFFRTSPFWFTILGAPLAWWPLVGGLVYLRRARRLKNPNALLRRALTTEPQLVASVEHGTYTPILPSVIGLVGAMIADSGRHGVSDHYYHTSGDDSPGDLSACIFVALTNGKKYRLSEYEDHAHIIAAICAHAPHAETPGSSQTRERREQEIPESGRRVRSRVALLFVGGLLLFACSTVIFVQFMNSRERTRFAQRGIRTTATVSDLSSFEDDESGKTHFVIEASFGTPAGKTVSRRTSELVDKSDHEKLKAGDTVEIYYLPEPPHYFALAESAERFREIYKPNIILVSADLGGVLMLIVGIVMSLKRTRRLTGATVNA